MRENNNEIVFEIQSLKRRLYELEKQLHQVREIEPLPEGELTVLVTRISEEPMAVLARDVLEVVPMPTLTPVPEAPPWLAGLLNLGGEVVPVVDVKARIERTRREYTVDDFIVLVRANEGRYGLVVQEIDRIHVSERDDLAPPPREVPAAPYLLGALKISGGTTLLFSVERLIALSDIPEAS